MQRKRLSKKEKKEISSFFEKANIQLDLKKNNLEEVKLEEYSLIYDLDSNVPLIIRDLDLNLNSIEDKKNIKSIHLIKENLPTIYLLNNIKHNFSSVRINKGAVKPVLNGANLMIPGIIDYNKFKKDEIILIKYEDSIIAIGYSLFDSTYLENNEKGAIINNIHYIKDDIWNFKL